MDEHMNYYSAEAQGEYNALAKLESFIDTLEVKEVKEEPVSEELEEASKKYSSCIYLEEVLSDDDKEVLKARLMNTFKAGANWQKQRIMGVIQKYADKGHHTYNDFEDDDISDTSELSYWDGFLSCAEGIKREL